MINIQTISGQRFTLLPVPMSKMPSDTPSDWLKFQGLHISGTTLSEKEQSKIQHFMKRHRTEALTDGEKNYTLAGGMLAECHPELFKPLPPQQVQTSQDVEVLSASSVLGSALAPNAEFGIIPPDVEKLLCNSFVAGVIYRNGDELFIPVHTGAEMYICDGWEFDVSEWKGIESILALMEQGDVPVPRRREDIGLPVGYVQLPDCDHSLDQEPICLANR